MTLLSERSVSCVVNVLKGGDGGKEHFAEFPSMLVTVHGFFILTVRDYQVLLRVCNLQMPEARLPPPPPLKHIISMSYLGHSTIRFGCAVLVNLPIPRTVSRMPGRAS